MGRIAYLSLIAVVLAHVHSTGASASNVEHSVTRWNGAAVHVVAVNLNSPDLRVTAAVAKNGAGSSESFSSMLGRIRPAAAITGTFFCTRSLLPTGDIVITGERIHSGSVGTGICFTPKNTVEFVPIREGRRSGWDGYDTVICAGPILVRHGVLSLALRDQGFTDPEIFRKKRRAALGVTRHNKLLLVTVNAPVSLGSLAKIMLHLGSVDAVNLDGGTSAALYCGGKVVTRPGRKLTNLLVVYDSLTDYYLQMHALAPKLAASGCTGAASAGTSFPPTSASSSTGSYADALPLPADYSSEGIIETKTCITDGR